MTATITSARVMGGRTAKVGSRVKHYGQRYTGCATATVIGFRRTDGDWIKVDVEPDEGHTLYGSSWDWDRTELAPDI